MKSIKKIKESSKAVAGTALLVGATLAGGAAMASSHTGGSSGSGDADLGHYPGTLLDDGVIDATIVMGSTAKATDVVAATNIAGQLGNNAFTTETQTVSVSGGVGGGFTATNGVTLDTQNDDLFYGDDINSIRQTLTQDNLEVLAETTFTDDSGDDTDVTNYLNIGTQTVQFGNDPEGIDDDEDPVLHVPVPSEGDVSPGSNLFGLQANFEDGIDMTSPDVAGEDIELFGTTYTIAEDNELTDSSERDELVLYGSSEKVSASTGESTTVTIDGEEATLEVVGVTGDNTAAVRVNGDLEQLDEDEEVTVNGQDIRADNVIQTNSDNSQGTVQFSIGSQELVLKNGQQIEDGDGDEVEGTHVEFNGEGSFSGFNAEHGGEEVSSIEVYVGAQDDDNDYVAAGETFSHDFLDQVEFQFAGLNPDAADAEGTTEVSVETNGDEEAQISFTADSGDTVTQDFIHTTNGDDSAVDGDDYLADSDNDEIHTSEATKVSENEYFVTDAGDFSHMWEVTSIDRDNLADSDTDVDSNDEATIDLRDVVTGDTVEVELDPSDYYLANTEDSSADYVGTEIIDGQTYYFALDAEGDITSDAGFTFAYGDGAQILDGSSTNDQTNTGGGGITYDAEGIPGATSLFTALDTENGGAVAFYAPEDFSEGTVSLNDPEVFEMPSTESTDAKLVEVGTTDSSPYVDVGRDGVQRTDASAESNTIEARVGQVVYDFEFSANDGAAELQRVTLDEDQSVDTDDDSGASAVRADDPAAVFMQPENEDDEENAFVLQPNGYDSDDGYSFSGGDARTYTGEDISVKALEATDEDTDAGYNEYGTYVEQDTEDEGSVSLHMPSGQSTAGAAFTGADGSISAEAGGSGSVETMTPTGFTSQYTALDSDSSVSQAKQNRDLVLVGGPAANGLVSELAQANETMTAGEYTEGQGMIQLVEDAFSEGNDALIVAGFSGEDTRAAGQYLLNYEQNSDMLAGQDQVSVNTAEGTVVQ